jgi:hypothetical protein
MAEMLYVSVHRWHCGGSSSSGEDQLAAQQKCDVYTTDWLCLLEKFSVARARVFHRVRILQKDVSRLYGIFKSGDVNAAMYVVLNYQVLQHTKILFPFKQLFVIVRE